MAEFYRLGNGCFKIFSETNGDSMKIHDFKSPKLLKESLIRFGRCYNWGVRPQPPVLLIPRLRRKKEVLVWDLDIYTDDAGDLEDIFQLSIESYIEDQENESEGNDEI